MEIKILDLYEEGISSFLRLRRDIFISERKWDGIKEISNMEVDNYDLYYTQYIIAFDNQGAAGGFRVNPTVDSLGTHLPTLVGDIFKDMLIDEMPRGLDVVDWSRFCVRADQRRGTASGNFVWKLFAAFQEYGLSKGIKHGLTIIEPRSVAALRRTGHNVTLLGEPKIVDGEEDVAVSVDVSEDTLKELQRRFNFGTLLNT